MFSNSELMSCFKVHLKYFDDVKYRDQQKLLERAPEEISEWPHRTILHFSMIVTSEGYQTGNYTGMQSPQAREYHRPQYYGYQAELTHRPQSFGYQAELMQKLQTGLNSSNITLVPSSSSFPTLKGKFWNRPSWRRVKRHNDHAEQLLIEKLYVYLSFFEEKIEAHGQMLNVRLEITQNYSPCEDCAAKIEEFIYVCRHRYHCNVDISITFATFYKVYRFYSKNGLVKLRRAGVKLYLIDDDLREKIQNLLIVACDIHEETIKSWVKERKLWDNFYMNKINDECNETMSPFGWFVIICIIIIVLYKFFFA
ncbi:hypothetical protein CHS0354_036300 [Potamilus streckersoni]|uniref:Uncharacterized protein n=1 Tax=Potamilus streckersoni TaxID=2493646 RepID=A0AAE0T7U7_9BIVA|nr:hypothetical protein CHS0354_036300 [Potamilus streckersoni]